MIIRCYPLPVQVALCWLTAFLFWNPMPALKAQSPCQSAEYRAFDFWLGDWVVYNAKGEKAGESLVERILDSCAIQEHWKSVKGFNGKSFNAFDPATGIWRQTWIDHTGKFMDFRGGFDAAGGFMRITTAPQPENGVEMMHRMTFSPMPNGIVRQLGEQSSDNGASWSVEYDLYYHRKSSATDLRELYWLADDWTMIQNGETTSSHETWRRVNDSLFRGEGYELMPGADTAVLENIDLAVKDGGIFYMPAVKGQNEGQPVPFRMVSCRDQEVVFENPEHDFPQRISYRLHGMDTLIARIEGRGRQAELVFLRSGRPETFEIREGDQTYLMRKFYLLTYKKGPQRNQSKAVAEQLQTDHLTHLNRLYERGKTCITGPTDGSGDIRGFVVFKVATREEAVYLGGLDPMVRAGRLTYDITPWYAAEGSEMK